MLSYLKRKFGKPSEKRFAVLLIDMQKYFLDSFDEYEKNSLIQNHINALEYCAQKQIPVIVVEWDGEGETIPVLREKIDQLPKRYFFIKDDDNAFKSRGFPDIVELTSANTLILMGINMSACVWDTAIGAKDHGYDVVIFRELVGNNASKSLQLEERSLCWFKRKTMFLENVPFSRIF